MYSGVSVDDLYLQVVCMVYYQGLIDPKGGELEGMELAPGKIQIHRLKIVKSVHSTNAIQRAAVTINN